MAPRKGAHKQKQQDDAAVPFAGRVSRGHAKSRSFDLIGVEYFYGWGFAEKICCLRWGKTRMAGTPTKGPSLILNVRQCRTA
jgi:hypothetical protein